MKTLAERKASIYFDANFPAYMKRWKALPPMPIKELEEAIVDHELIQHLNYEQSGEEGYLRKLYMEHFYTLPEDWKDQLRGRLNEALDIADAVAEDYAESYPTVAELAQAYANLTENLD